MEGMDWPDEEDKSNPSAPASLFDRNKPKTTNKPLGDGISLNSEEDRNVKGDTRNLDGIREEQGVYGLPEVEVSPDYETDEDIPIKGASLPYSENTEEDKGSEGTGLFESGNYEDIAKRRSETQLNFNLKTGSASSDPPLSAKSTADVLEEDETLDDFVRREKEIAQELEESGEFEAGHLAKRETESLQKSSNRPERHDDSDYDDSDYPEGFPLEYPKDPPPAYQSPRKNTERQSSWDQEMEPEPSGSKEPLQRGFSQTSATGIGSLIAAGGAAAAVAGIKNVPIPTKIEPTRHEELEESDDDMDYYTDNIRDQEDNEHDPQKQLGYRTAFPELHSDLDDEDDEEKEEAEVETHQPPSTMVMTSIPEPEPEPEIKYPLSNELKGFFHLIEEFAADKIEIEPILKPFLLDYIPAVGDVDPFIKIPRPDEVEDNLGLIVLDEPAAAQSDPTIISMQLQQSSSTGFVSDAPVKKVTRADKNTQQIDKWIENIKELRRGRPPDRVSYGKPMPDIEKLMQEWNPEMENMLKTLSLPSAKLDASLEEYVDLVLGIVDIPVHKSRIHSLYLLFSLYLEFKNSQHFRNLAANNLYQGPDQPHPSTVETNRLELL